ncbi:ABC transporter permease [Gloeobacter kilaueensis]|uniref:Macrolide transporter ATP-binding /permease protein n=1 Tax=Gloeobacter kilaueensis (strain ATCC BAA-2537 / CCAP 1431/1 / ULC 316 / JS1) TaxID=1183438 RepID=U5QS28_GLOK1|nr:ABC transporter permease [Gloeobacter kilaueensis]AGY60429.1 macrolide transporter ATP-binding /permease protein [Gloeobacter kilaueensis JS1]
MQVLIQDLSYGLRSLLSKPVFTVVALVALALGIGANTAVFSVVNAVLLKPFPYKHPEQLIVVSAKDGQIDEGVSYPDYLDYREARTSFTQSAAFLGESFVLSGGGQPERLRGAFVSSGYLSTLGIAPVLGRDFLPQEDLPGYRSVLLSYSFWQSRYRGDPGVLGRSLRLNGQLFTIVGVLPQGISFKYDEQFLTSFGSWLTKGRNPKLGINDPWGRGNHFSMLMIARLRTGHTLDQARSELAAIAARLARQYPDTNATTQARAVSLSEFVLGNIRTTLLVLMAAVLFVLLITAANVANLQIARSAARRREVALRTALGASRGRIVRQLLTESLLLSSLGALIGLIVASLSIAPITALIPADVPRASQVAIDLPVLLFAIGVAVAAGVGFGVGPAMAAARTSPAEVLKEDSRGAIGGRRQGRLRNSLIVAEVGLALVLLCGAALMLQSFIKLRSVEPGFSTTRTLSAYLSLPAQSYPDADAQRRFAQRLIEQLHTLPGVRSAAIVNDIPLTHFQSGAQVEVPGYVGKELPYADYLSTSPGYFELMGIPLLAGRTFDEQDQPGQPGAVIVNDLVVRRFFPDGNAVGKRLRLPGISDWLTIVGVVRCIHQNDLKEPPNLQVYRPFAQDPWAEIGIVLKSDIAPTALAASLQRAVQSIDSDLPVTKVRSLQKVIDDSVQAPRLTMVLLAIFAGIALVNAAIGIYGVMSYSVSQRTHEIGVRMALGALPADVLKLVVGQGMLLVLVGVAIGLAGGLVGLQLLSSLLFGIGASDPITFGAVAMLLVLVALVACYLPARRATRIDPAIALRYE